MSPFKNRQITIVSGICICVFFLTKCLGKDQVVEKIKFSDYVGSEACKSCHQSIVEKHKTTPHFFASHPATLDFIKGSFANGENIFSFSSSSLVRMEKRSDGLYQAAYDDGIEKRAEPFDIVFGSGTKGQTYLYWKNKDLFQLPITYFTPYNQWCNSPGYPGKARFDRPITSRCLECHSTYFKKISGENNEPESFDRSKIIYGISCERCHGPAAEHVSYHLKNPSDTVAKYIINTGKLSRQQNLDLCGLCHGGRLKKTQPSFSYQPGDKLSDYFTQVTIPQFGNEIDVHGNQLGLLSKSKCFLQTNMTCTSCHNPHDKERGNLQLFSQRCLNCHSTGHGTACTVKINQSFDIKNDCISCHMPKQPSMAIAVFLQGQDVPTPALLRSHFIKIYPEETKKFLNHLKEKDSARIK